MHFQFTINLNDGLCIVQSVTHKAHILLHPRLQDARIALQWDDAVGLAGFVAEDVVSALLEKTLSRKQLEEAALWMDW